jgi:hypothetical protein
MSEEEEEEEGEQEDKKKKKTLKNEKFLCFKLLNHKYITREQVIRCCVQ